MSDYSEMSDGHWFAELSVLPGCTWRAEPLVLISFWKCLSGTSVASERTSIIAFKTSHKSQDSSQQTSPVLKNFTGAVYTQRQSVRLHCALSESLQTLDRIKITGFRLHYQLSGRHAVTPASVYSQTQLFSSPTQILQSGNDKVLCIYLSHFPPPIFSSAVQTCSY